MVSIQQYLTLILPRLFSSVLDKRSFSVLPKAGSSACWRTGTNMEPTGSGISGSANVVIAKAPLICGLPDDVGLLCLARVPRKYHGKLKCVSKRWREVVGGEEWRIVRKKYNLQQIWIYALCRTGDDITWRYEYRCYVLDPHAGERYWKRIQDLPARIVHRANMHLEVLGTKAYLIGGGDYTGGGWSDSDSDSDSYCDRIKDVGNEVYCYDATTNCWSKGVPLSSPRHNFASEVLDGKIYTAGIEFSPDLRHIWEVYDPITNIWTSDQSGPQLIGREKYQCIVFDEKLFVRNFFSATDVSGAVYDPATATWQNADNDFLAGWRGPSVVADGRLYSFELWPEYKLRMWQEDMKKWIVVAELESYFWGNPVDRIAAIGKSIFFVGDGLATTELDLSSVGKGEQLKISRLTDSFYNVIPFGCKCITI